jgi:hypothetical protein
MLTFFGGEEEWTTGIGQEARPLIEFSTSKITVVGICKVPWQRGPLRTSLECEASGYG